PEEIVQKSSAFIYKNRQKKSFKCKSRLNLRQQYACLHIYCSEDLKRVEKYRKNHYSILLQI
ncbi:hypothetical protein Dimus_037516, partial [Dionaea muscipula]